MTQDASLGRLPPIHSTSSILAPVPASCVVGFIDIVIVIVVAVVIVIVVNIFLHYAQPVVFYLFY